MIPIKLYSTQQKVRFSFCPSPVTIDKSSDWGPGNLQSFPDGVFLKHNSDGTISHGVQPKEDKSAPVGWIPDDLGGEGTFCKSPIWIGERYRAGVTVEVETLDGVMNYKTTEDSYICYNGEGDSPNLKDAWIQSVSELKKNYQLTIPS